MVIVVVVGEEAFDKICSPGHEAFRCLLVWGGIGLEALLGSKTSHHVYQLLH